MHIHKLSQSVCLSVCLSVSLSVSLSLFHTHTRRLSHPLSRHFSFLKIQVPNATMTATVPLASRHALDVVVDPGYVMTFAVELQSEMRGKHAGEIVFGTPYQVCVTHSSSPRGAFIQLMSTHFPQSCPFVFCILCN